MFPSSDPFVCSPLPSNGSRGRHFLRGPAVPHLHRYYGLIRSLPIRHPGSLVALDPELLPQIARKKLEGFPKFLENPFESVPRARDSGGSWRPRLTVTRMLPSVILKTSASAMSSISELNPRSPLSRCLRFSPAGHPTTGKTRYRLACYGFSRTGLSPVGFFSKGFIRSHGLPLSQALLGAIK